jgi:hypothetical protein
MKKFITKAYLKFSKLGSGVEKFNKISKKIIVRQLIKDNGIQFLKLVRLVNKLHENRIS